LLGPGGANTEVLSGFAPPVLLGRAGTVVGSGPDGGGASRRPWPMNSGGAGVAGAVPAAGTGTWARPICETYLKVRGRWAYLYGTIDRAGRLVDAMLSVRRDVAAAPAFLRSAKATTGVIPDRVTTDAHGSYPRAVRTTLDRRVAHRASAFKSNRLEMA
jgi:hypothetical protein